MWVTLISFHPQALNAPCFLLEHQWMFKPFLIVVFESLSSPQCEKDGSQNHTVTARKGSNKQKMLKNWRFCRTWRIILKNRAQFYCSEQTRDSWTIITKQKQSWIIQRNTHGIKVVLIIAAILLSCGINVNIFYIKYLTQDSTKKKKKTCILYDLSYLVKITHIFGKGYTNFRAALYLYICMYVISEIWLDMIRLCQTIKTYIFFKR